MKNINVLAPVKCSKSIRIQAMPAQVWAVLTDIDRWAEWNKDIAQPRLQGALVAGATFTWKSGGAKIHSTLHTVAPNSELGWTGKTFGMFAVHNWRLSADQGGTVVAVEESMEGLLAKLFRKSFSKSLEKGMQHWLEALKQQCEASNA